MRPVLRLFALLFVASGSMSAQSSDLLITPVGGNRSGLMHIVNMIGPDSPDGRFVLANAVGGADSGWSRYDRTTKQWQLLTRDSFREAAWSPNGRFLVYSKFAEKNQWRVWLLPMNPATGVPSGPARQISARDGRTPIWSPDSRRIAFHSTDSGRFKVVIVPFNGGEERVLVDGASPRTCRGWAPDGSSLYCEFVQVPASAPRRIVRVNVESKKVDTLRTGGGLLGLSKDGRFLAEFHPTQREVVITSASDGHVVRTESTPPSISIGQWSNAAPDRLLASRNVILSNLHAVSLEDGRIRKLTTGDERDWGPHFSPDGKRIAFVRLAGDASRPALMNADGTGARVIAGSADASGAGNFGQGNQMSWSPDGRQLSYLSTDLALHVIDVESGKDRALVGGSDTLRVVALAWQSDSKTLRFVAIAARNSVATGRDVREVRLDGHTEHVGSLPDSVGVPLFVNDSTVAFLKLDLKAGLFASATGLGTISFPRREPRTLYTGPLRQTSGPVLALSSDRRWIAAIDNGATGQRSLRLISLSGERPRAIPNTLGEIGEVYFVPGNRLVVAAVCSTCDGGDEHWDLVAFPLNGDPPKVLTPRTPSSLDAVGGTSSPDGRTFVYQSELAYRSGLVDITLRALKP